MTLCAFLHPTDEVEPTRNQAQSNSRVALMKPCKNINKYKVPKSWETPDAAAIMDENENSADPEE